MMQTERLRVNQIMAALLLYRKRLLGFRIIICVGKSVECTVVSSVVARSVMLSTLHPKTHSKYLFHYCNYF